MDAVAEALSAAFASGKEKLVTIESKLDDSIADCIEDVMGQDAYTAESWAVMKKNWLRPGRFLRAEI